MTINFLVGYDSLHMKLDGKFSYLKENQRTLSFNVDIVKLPKHKTVFAGSSSEYEKCQRNPKLLANLKKYSLNFIFRMFC